MKLTLVKDLIDACNCIIKKKGDVWNVNAIFYDEHKQLYITGYGWYNYSLFEETKNRL